MKRPLIRRAWDARSGRFIWEVVPVVGGWGLGPGPDGNRANLEAQRYCAQRNVEGRATPRAVK